MSVPVVSFYTLGCKLNQFETIYIAHIFEKLGYESVEFPSRADVYLINTCTVTAKSERHSKYAARRAINCNPDAIVIVTGCACQVNPETFQGIRGIDLILGNKEKEDIEYFLKGLKKKVQEPDVIVSAFDRTRDRCLSPMRINRFSDYTRAFIKVQDGCNSFCTYCIVPQARGPARSVPIEEVASQAGTLWEAGYKEAVLTGIHLGQYGRDAGIKNGLSGLLSRLLENIGNNRLRLSSIEPNEFTEDVLESIEKGNRICPHFHIPLQSGSTKILNKMGRGYTPSLYRDLIHEIIKRIPSASIGADVMVGFPGETEKDFSATCELIESLPLAYLHVFSFSERPGTPAFDFPGKIDASTKKQRSSILRDLSQRKKREFRKKVFNMVHEALILNQPGPGTDLKIALSGNYLPVFIKADNSMVNKLVMVKIDRIDKEKIWGSITHKYPYT